MNTPDRATLARTIREAREETSPEEMGEMGATIAAAVLDTVAHRLALAYHLSPALKAEFLANCGCKLPAADRH